MVHKEVLDVVVERVTFEETDKWEESESRREIWSEREA
jgi:hypothetical protein